MAQKVVIEVESLYRDHVTMAIGRTDNEVRKLKRDISETSKEMDKLGKKDAKPKVSVTDRISKKLNELQAKTDKLGKTKVSATIGVLDNATRGLGDIISKAKSFAGEAYNATVGVLNSDGMKALGQMGASLKNLVGRTWRVTVGVVDKVTAPVRSMVGKMNSLLGLAGAGISTYGLVVKPIQMQVEYQDLVTSFEVLLGSADKAKKRIDDLTAFASKTPFTRDELYKASRILEVYTQGDLSTPDSPGGMKMVGDIAAGTNTDYLSVATWVGRLYSALKGGRSVGEMTAALQEMGALSAEARNRIEELAESGKNISQVWPQVTKEFSRFDDIMLKQADNLGNLLLGVKSFITNNFLKKIGSGISSELTPFLDRFRTWRSENSAMIAEWGTAVEEFASKVSGKALGAIEKLASRTQDVLKSDEFRDADGFFGKAKVLWDEIIGKPLSEWWNGSGKSKVVETAGDIGQFIGEGITAGIMAIFGIKTDFMSEGFDVGRSFVDGFKSGFNSADIAESIWKGFKTFFKNHPILSTMITTVAISKLIGSVTTGLADAKFGQTAGLTGVASTVGNLKTLYDTATLITGSAAAGKLGGFVAKNLIGTSAGMAGGRLITGGLMKGATLSAGLASGLGLAAGAGAIAGGATVVSGVNDLRKGYTAGNEFDKKYNNVKGWTKLGGVGAGAAIGTMILPGMGTLIGAGIGGIAGWLASGKVADNIVGTKEALDKYNTSSSEAARIAEEQKQKEAELAQSSLAEHFGKVSLSADDVAKSVSNIIGNDKMTKFNEMRTTLDTLSASYASMEEASLALKKNMWYASVAKGAKLSSEEITGLKQSVKSFTDSAKDYVTESQFASSQAITHIMGNDKDAKSIIDASTAYYKEQQSALNKLSKEYDNKLGEALVDGKITVDEQASLDEIRAKIEKITAQLNKEQEEKDLNILKLRLSGDIDDTSFKEVIASAQEKNKTLQSQYEEEFGQASIGLKEGSAEYLKLQGGTLNSIGSVHLSTGNFGFDKIREKYKKELGILSTDLKSIGSEYKLEDIIAQSMKMTDTDRASIGQLVDAMAPTTEEIGRLKGQYDTLIKAYEDAGMEVPDAIQKGYDRINEYLKNAEFMDALADGPEAVQKFLNENQNFIWKTTLDVYADERIQDTIDILAEDFGIEPELATTIGVLITGDKEILNQIDTSTLAEELGVPEETAKIILTKLSGEKEIVGKVKVLAEELGVPPEIAETLGLVLSGDKQIQDKVSVDPKDFGVKDEYHKTVTLKISAIAEKIGNVWNSITGQNSSNKKQRKSFRGGIYGGSYGGAFFGGGYVHGGAQEITVAEEGDGEAIIPLSLRRRDRALELWEQTGRILGADRNRKKGFATGGMIGMDTSSPASFNREPQTLSGAPGGNNSVTVSVNVGGVTIEVKSDGNGDVAETMNQNKEAIAEQVASIFNSVFKSQFENMPARG